MPILLSLKLISLINSFEFSFIKAATIKNAADDISLGILISLAFILPCPVMWILLPIILIG